MWNIDRFLSSFFFSLGDHCYDEHGCTGTEGSSSLLAPLSCLVVGPFWCPLVSWVIRFFWNKIQVSWPPPTPDRGLVWGGGRYSSCRDQGPYAPQGSTSLLQKLSVTSKVSAPTSCAWVGSRVHFRSSEDITLWEFTSPVDREYMHRRRKFQWI